MWFLTTLCALGVLVCIPMAILQRDKEASDFWHMCFIGFLGMMAILGIVGRS